MSQSILDAGQMYYEDVVIGATLHGLTYGPVTTMHIVRWSAAIENWHRIHFDQTYARGHEGLPDVVIAGSWKQQLLASFCKEVAGVEGWMWKLQFQHRAQNTPGELLTPWGTVESAEKVGDLGMIKLRIGLVSDSGVEACPGNATLIVPTKEGPAVPYPFVVPSSFRDHEG